MKNPENMTVNTHTAENTVSVTNLTTPQIILRDYQKEMLNAVWLEAQNTQTKIFTEPLRLACVQPTGAGKTIEILSLADKLYSVKRWRTLIVVPTRKLVKQTVEKAEEFFPDLKTGSIAGGKWNVTENDAVVIGTAAGISGRKLKNFSPADFQMVVIDEAHHITAASYIRLLRYFSKAKLQIGLTATFRRGDGVSILADEYFPTLLVWHTVAQLTDAGFLAPALGSFVYTTTSLAKVKKRSNGDFDERSLAQAVDTPERNTAAVKAWMNKAVCIDYPEGRPTVCFTAGIGHAKHLAEEFNHQGIRAEAVWGKQNEKEQEEIFTDYRSGQVKVLTNAMLLTEGWDEPATSCVLITRPATVASSFVLGPQMIGRGLRTHPGKKDALIIELRDSAGDDDEENDDSLLAATMDLSEKDIVEDEPLHQQKKKAEKKACQEELEYLAGQIGEIEFTSELFDVIEKLEKISRLAWIPLGSRLCMNLSGGDFLEVTEDGQGRFSVNLIEKGSLRQLSVAPNRQRAMTLGENWLISNKRDHTFVRRDAAWRTKTPTGAAVNRANKLTGRNKTDLEKMNRGEISDLINAATNIKTNTIRLNTG